MAAKATERKQQILERSYMARFSIRDIGLLILCVSLGLAAYRDLWMPPPNPNSRPILAAYLAVLTMTTLGSAFAKPPWRRPCQGYSLFAWLNLIFVMYGGFWLHNIYDAERLVLGCELGVSLGVICAVLAGWLLPETAKKSET